jgi:hypothetical protein
MPEKETLRRVGSGAEKGNLWPTPGESLAAFDSFLNAGAIGMRKFFLKSTRRCQRMHSML